MGKLILISVVMMAVAIPVIAARTEHPKKALKQAVFFFFAFNAFYLFALRVLLPRVGG